MCLLGGTGQGLPACDASRSPSALPPKGNKRLVACAGHEEEGVQTVSRAQLLIVGPKATVNRNLQIKSIL
jgi:hypothetical protein